MRYLIWDFDGTLAVRPGGWSGLLCEILGAAHPELACTRDDLRPHMQQGYPWDTPDQPHLGQTAAQWWDALHPLFTRALVGVGVPADAAAHLAGQMRQRYPDLAGWRLFPDTIPTLTALAGQGWTHLVLSNHCPELPAICAGLGVTPWLARIYCSADLGYEKPHPAAFRAVLDALEPGAPVCMIGDNPIADIKGAEAAGIPAILVRRGDLAARYVCADLEALPACLAQVGRERGWPGNVS